MQCKCLPCLVQVKAWQWRKSAQQSLSSSGPGGKKGIPRMSRWSETTTIYDHHQPGSALMATSRTLSRIVRVGCADYTFMCINKWTHTHTHIGYTIELNVKHRTLLLSLWGWSTHLPQQFVCTNKSCYTLQSAKKRTKQVQELRKGKHIPRFSVLYWSLNG